MLETPRARRGMVTAPHHLAAEAGLDILKAGGTAAEAAVAVAATLAVVYPHMTGIGGDGFWLFAEPGKTPQAIDACGRAGSRVSLGLYADRGLTSIPWRGPLAANTVAGAIAGWHAALTATRHWGKPLPLARLLEAPISYARDGYPVTRSQAMATAGKLDELRSVPGFFESFLIDGALPREGAIMRLPRLADTFEQLARGGLDDFYQGEIAQALARDLEDVGSPLTLQDLQGQQAVTGAPLQAEVHGATLYNMPPPTQGLASLMILGIFDRLGVREAEGFAHVHGLVEATKQAFLIRDEHVGDPEWMEHDPRRFLEGPFLDDLARRIDPAHALPWPAPSHPGDTTWFGACDREGRSVSAIQSIYFEFGSGLVLPRTGVTWQNRGSSFRLVESGWNSLKPARKPFHTLSPAMASFGDGRLLSYGTMGGEGQPQTQAAIFTRYGFFGQPLQAALTAPRWLLGRTWGSTSTTLKLESRFRSSLIETLDEAGHEVEIVPEFSDLMGHAGALARHSSGIIEGATDPRSDGGVAGW